MKRGSHHEKVVERGIVPRFADPLWDEQWYLVSFPTLLNAVKDLQTPLKRSYVSRAQIYGSVL